MHFISNLIKEEETVIKVIGTVKLACALHIENILVNNTSEMKEFYSCHQNY